METVVGKTGKDREPSPVFENRPLSFPSPICLPICYNLIIIIFAKAVS